ncbi:hypothetical protein L596_013396 [Steinernema carpocapsae]|uniref:Major facilitator superfamily (MFS) profile domain-containing protein n=1 Tax=Steinernema carpocapsae TaxID=34508 RepID=A0A4U5P0W2_STECR|nr:hypothetical protein L596_013396 [Steinernema carpocapsae]
MDSDKEKLSTARLDDFTKLGRHTVLLCIFAELMVLSQLGNMLYMMYAGWAKSNTLCRPDRKDVSGGEGSCSAPTIIGCGEHDLTHAVSSKEACDLLAQLQANSSCEMRLDVQFESVNYEWNYLCDGTKEVKNSISMQMIGVMVGSVLFGQMSDMYGRKLTMLICLFGCITISFASSYTHNLFWFTVCRFVIGVFNGGHIAVLLVFMIENLPKKHRLWINTIVTWSPNMVIYAAMAYYANNWRTLAQWSSFTTIPAFLLCLQIF